MQMINALVKTQGRKTLCGEEEGSVFESLHTGTLQFCYFTMSYFLTL